MAKVFTQEEREKIKGQVVELVRRSGRETLRQLEVKTGATRYLMSVLARELVASGDVYNSVMRPAASYPMLRVSPPSVTLTGRPRLSYAMVLRLPSGDIVAVRSPAALYS